MKTNIFVKTLGVFLLLCVNLLQAQNVISGSVTDAETNEPIPGANIVIQGTAEGTTADFDGNFSLNTGQSFPFTIEVTTVGFSPQLVEVSSADQNISVALQPGENLDEIIVSASRRPQKVQEAPASVSLVTAKDIENSAIAVDPVRHLVNVPGVQLQQQSANRLNIEMRAGSGVFGSSAFPILDYRFLSTPASGQFLSFTTGLSNIDIAKIEVVRGAASALYGPGVTSGVVHFMTKNPIDYPGTTVELLAGTLDTYGATIRHAFSSEDKKFGYKINARYVEGTDFTLDDQEDADQIAGFSNTIAYPDITPNGYVDASSPGRQLLDINDLDDNNDGNPLATEYRNWSVNAHAEFRPNEKTSAFASAGVANGGALMFNSQGAGYQQGTDYWAQARVQSGGLFGQVSYNYNDGGTDENPTFLYASGFRQVAKRSSLEAQLQYNFDIPSFLNTNITVGGDYRDISSDSEQTLFGRYDADDDYIIMGAYMQGTSSLTDQLDLTYAVRYDDFNLFDEGIIAPRVALVYKASDKHTFRASYNQAAFGPTALEQFIDFPVAVLAPGVLDVWLSGQADPQGFSANPTIDLSVPGLPDLPANATQFPLAYAYGAVAGQVLPALFQGLAGNPLLPVVQNFFNSYMPSGGSGTLVPYNLFNQQAMGTPGNPLLAATTDAKPGKLNSFEVGYKGIIGDKLSVAVDFYTYERQGFTQFTAIGPTFNLVGSDFATDLAAQVSSDFAADPTINAAVTGAVQAQYTAQGVPQAIWGTGAPAGALFPGSPAIAPVSAAVGALIQQAAGGVSQAFAAGGAGFDSAIAPLLQTIGAVETTRVPQNDGILHIPAGYRRFGNATRSHFGADVALEYFANDNWTIFANGSWLSQNKWIPGEDNDDGLEFSSFLNAPDIKFRGGVKYYKDNVRGSLTYQHDAEFESDQGVYSGIVQEKNLFDANIGYTFSNGVKLDLAGSNIFDFKYRAFPGMPVIGRRVVLKATFDL